MKRKAPAASRNRAPIAAVLREELPKTGLVLEIASGTGEHALHFAREFPQLAWQPTDPDPDALASIAAWRDDGGPTNFTAPLELDASKSGWPLDAADAIVCINMVHISPWAATEGLFTGASRLLSTEAPLILYGPYLEGDVATAPSNIAFDASLKRRDPAWSLREVGAVDRLATEHGFVRTKRVAMPANNLMLVYRRRT